MKDLKPGDLLQNLYNGMYFLVVGKKGTKRINLAMLHGMQQTQYPDLVGMNRFHIHKYYKRVA